VIQIVDHLCVRAVGLYLQIEGGVHVHRNGLDMLASLFAQQFEEWPDRLATVDLANHSTCMHSASMITAA